MNCRIPQEVGILAEMGILIDLDFSVGTVPGFVVCCLLSDVMSSAVYPGDMTIWHIWQTRRVLKLPTICKYPREIPRALKYTGNTWVSP